MGYRFAKEQADKKERLNVYPIRANALLNLSFGCYYMDGHDSKLHDHIGWPNPDNVDSICQIQSNGKLIWPYNNKTLNLDKIDLIEEGYTGAIVTTEPTGITFEESPETTRSIDEYFSADAFIDAEEHNLVRFQFGANFLECGYDVKTPIDVVFTLYVWKPLTDKDSSFPFDKMDAVEHGIIRILPASSHTLTY